MNINEFIDWDSVMDGYKQIIYTKYPEFINWEECFDAYVYLLNVKIYR